MTVELPNTSPGFHLRIGVESVADDRLIVEAEL